MAQRVEIPTGAINGVNATFFTSVPYQPGSLSLWLNGQQILGCYAETNPATGEVTITDADYIPRAGAWGSDSIVVDYNDTSTDPDVVRIDELLGVVDDVPIGIDGILAAPRLAGVVADVATGIAGVVAFDRVSGVIDDVPAGILGTVEDC